MKTRIISALVGTVVLLAVLFCPWVWVFALVVAAAAGLATYELLHNTGIVKSKWMNWGSVVFAAAEVLLITRAFELSHHEYMESPMFALYFAAVKWSPIVCLSAYALFALVLFAVFRQSFVWKAFGLTLYATIGFGAVGCLRMFPIVGLVYVLLPMVIAWMSDTGAYFTGVFFGKHKMAPVISPKKTWEGFFGGWVISIGLTVLYGVICNAIVGEVFELWMLAIIATVLAPLSVVGDLMASLIKRRTGIKDYGNIMPGHGGVMDRFDSVVFIAPLSLAAVMVVLMS